MRKKYGLMNETLGTLKYTTVWLVTCPGVTGGPGS